MAPQYQAARELCAYSQGGKDRAWWPVNTREQAWQHTPTTPSITSGSTTT
jgi:hypothetical protein